MINCLRLAIIRRLHGFATAEDGVSAVEFAMLLPLMITLYFGSIEITQAVSADRKMTVVAGTIGDLVARTACVTQSDIDGTFQAGLAVLYPYDATKVKMTITQVIVDANQQATVADATGGWSLPYNGASTHTGNVTTSIPAALRTTAGAVIWAEASYTYVPTMGKVIAPTGIALSDQVFFKPRVSTTIPKKASCP
jgi:Flp pilus assembly protein TadG